MTIPIPPNPTEEDLKKYGKAMKRLDCQCSCHENKLNKPYIHDTKCCDNMNGYVEQDKPMQNKLKTMQKSSKPIQNDTQTIQNDWEKEEWCGWKIVSDMLDNPDENGIYPTSECYQKLYDFISTLLSEQEQKIKKTINSIPITKPEYESDMHDLGRKEFRDELIKLLK